MIHASDLRIGNWVTGSFPNMIVQKIDKYGVELYMSESDSDDFSYDLDEIYPIELTPEILEAVGFKFREHLDDHYIRISEFNDRNDILILSKYNTLVCASNSQPVFFKHITSLHQLQNLYHSLTGSDLKIELPTTGKE